MNKHGVFILAHWSRCETGEGKEKKTKIKTHSYTYFIIG